MRVCRVVLAGIEHWALLLALAGLVSGGLFGCVRETVIPQTPQSSAEGTSPTRAPAEIAEPATRLAEPTSRPTISPTSEPTPRFVAAPTPTPTPAFAPLAIPFATPPVAPAPMPAETPQPSPQEVAEDQLGALLTWFANPPNLAHSLAASHIVRIWLVDEWSAKAVVSLPWVIDGITEDEGQVLVAIAKAAGNDTSVALALATLPWIADGVTGGEAQELAWFEGNSGDPESAEVILGYPWMRNGISTNERQSWEYLLTLTVANPELARRVINLRWIADGLTGDEAEALAEFKRIFRIDAELAWLVSGHSWFKSEIGYDDTQVLYGLARIAGSDPAMAKTVAGNSWLADVEAPTSRHWMPLDDLNIVASRNRALAWQLAALLSGNFGRGQRDMLSALRRMIQEEKEAWAELNNQAWFQDGLSDEEAAFLLVAPDILENSPTEFHEMLEVRYVESRAVNLPLSGSVDIRLIQKAPLSES